MRILLRRVILSAVEVRLMARPAIRRRSRVSIRMTCQTVRLYVRAGQRELRRAMIERRFRPVVCRVANRAILRIIFRHVIRIGRTVVVALMARPTIRWRTCVSRRVACLTLRLNVRTGQRELRRVVIKHSPVPLVGRMTNFTALRVLLRHMIRIGRAVVVALMACPARCRCSRVSS